MTIAELQKLIKDLIKSKKLSDYLLNHLEIECKLNSLHALSFLIENAKFRFEAKIKACQRIEEVLSIQLILPGDSFLLEEKLDSLRFNLAILYVIEIEHNYNELKNFILKILNFKDINLKLKIFDLTIKLLEKTIKFPQFNKKFMDALSLLKLFINDSNALDSVDLLPINNLDDEVYEKDIQKAFYKIIFVLNEKLVFRVLLDQLLLIIKHFNNSSLTQFNLIFITNCSKDPSMDTDDFNQLIALVFGH